MLIISLLTPPCLFLLSLPLSFNLSIFMDGWITDWTGEWQGLVGSRVGG